MSPEFLKRFWSKVNKTKSCWEWIACVNEAGYGMIGTTGKKIDRAHRVSYRIHFGEIPERMFVCHKCDNPRCVNPEHLFIGTNQDNVNDMILKKRNSKPPSMGGWNKKVFSDEIIKLIGKHPDTHIAKLAGVSKYAIQGERSRRGIPPFPSQTRFKKNGPHPRWQPKERREFLCQQKLSK